MNATAHQAARTLLEALQQLRFDQPLAADDGRYVDTALARGDFNQAKVIRSLEACLAGGEGSGHYYLYSGHIGCGKSTELRRLAAKLHAPGRFYVVMLDTLEDLDPHNLRYVDWSPEPEHTGELIRLHKLLAGSAGRFALILACYDQPVYRDRLIAHLRSVLPGLAQTKVDSNDLPGIVDLERYLTQHADERGPLHVVGLDRWFSMETDGDTARRRIAGFNLHRDYLAALARRPLFLWLLKHQVRDFARLAPDAWEWRAAVLDFARRVAASGLDLPVRVDHGHAPREERVQRIDEIERFLSRHDTRLSPGERVALWDELGQIQQDLGDWAAAQRAYEAAQGQCELGDDQRGVAQARVKIAYLLWRQGDPDQALRSLAAASAAFERLGDVRSKAAALFKIAQVHLAREAYPEAMDGLAEAYAIVEGLQDAQGLAHVGKVYGQRLYASGEQARGTAVLGKAAEAFGLLGQDDEAQAIQTIIRELQDGKPG